MSNSEIVRQKRRGRPKIGQLPVISFRMDPGVQEEIDHWRSLEPNNPSRSKAIRHLIIFGLAAAGEEVREEIDHWRSLEPDNPSRSNAIRCLLMMGLSTAEDGCAWAGGVQRVTRDSAT